MDSKSRSPKRGEVIEEELRVHVGDITSVNIAAGTGLVGGVLRRRQAPDETPRTLSVRPRPGEPSVIIRS